jgi:hypothetical protein
VNTWVIAAWVVGVLAALYGLHRLALWLEREGWIRYVRNPPHAGGGTGAAFGNLQRIFEPQTRHVYEMKHREKPKREADGGEPEPPQPA